MTCPRCGSMTTRAGLCQPCAVEQRAEAAANTCSADGCSADTAGHSPFCAAHDEER